MVFAFVYWASRKMTIRPKGKQNALEMIYDFVIGFTKPNIGESYIKDYSLFLFSLFLFILVANNIGLMAKAVSYTHLDVYKRQGVFTVFDFATIWLFN